MHPIAELTLEHQPDAVPQARRLARASVEQARPELAYDAELVVSELVTNACLHGLPPVAVRVLVDGVVRVEVEDAGRTPPIVLARNPEAMTGRGLALVASLARSWGVDPVPSGGKVVWAELDGTSGGTPTTPDAALDIDALLDAWTDDDATSTYTVRLGAVPTDLLLSAKAHIDNVVRELTLMREGQASSGIALPPEVAALIDAVTVDFAEARAEIKRQAAAAAASGELVTDLELQLHISSADAGERYLAALDESDRYARSAHLLTLAPPAVHRIFRRWYVTSIVEQLRAIARLEAAPAARPFQVVLTEEVGRLAGEAAASRRLAMLQEVTGELAGARSPEDMARIVVERAVHFLGVETAKVRLLTPERTLRTVAWAGAGSGGPDPIGEYPLDADLPGAEAVRTGRPAFMRSVRDAVAHVPGMGDHYREGASGHAMPLIVGDDRLGLLSLTFVAGEMSDDAEIAVVESLADALAQALRRAQLAASEAETRQSLQFLADATQLLVSVRRPGEVMEQLVRLAVPRLGNWCTVFLTDGTALRRVAMAVDRHPELAERLLGRPLPVDADTPQARAFRTGRPQWMDGAVGHVLAGVYPDIDIAELGMDPDRMSGLAVPIELRGERLGVIGLTFDDGRRVTPTMVETVSGLGARAALALDAALRWSEQSEMVQALVRTLLPDDPPELSGVQFAARYMPASGEVAGDWWETQPMADGTVLVGVGDAAGHGLAAVSRMSQLRHGARALAVVERGSARLLTALNRELAGSAEAFATAVYGRLDPATGELCWARAGHVPPLHVGADGTVTLLDAHSAPPLGTPWEEDAGERKLDLGVGELLVLYTDGVVERRNERIDEGIGRLVATVGAHAGEPLDALADRIMDEHCSQPVDDCCLLLLRRTEP